MRVKEKGEAVGQEMNTGPDKEEQLVKNAIDKKCLYRAVKSHSKMVLKEFTWHKQIPATELGLNVLKVEGLGDISIPVSLKDVNRLKSISESGQYGNGYNKSYDPSMRQAWEIDSSKLENVDISLLLSSHLELHWNMLVKAKLHKLILYETDGHYKDNVNLEEEFGPFATTTLQLPVEGGHKGGRLSVEYKGKRILFENDQNEESLYVATTCKGCHESMEPIISGWRVTLVFHLNWINSKTQATKNYPVFLTALKEVEEALAPWIPNRRIKESTMDVIANENLATSETNDTATQNQDLPDTCPMNDSSEEEAGNPADDEDMKYLNKVSCPEDVLFFVLREKYEENDISFHGLRGEDRDLAHLLQSCDFLDVHLAMVKCSILRDGYYSRSNVNELKSAEASRWIDSNDVVRNLSLRKLNWKKHRVGSNRNFLATFRQLQHGLNSTTTNNYGIVMRQNDFYHCILVIWPKHQSVRMYCLYGLQSLLSRMESSLRSAYYRLEDQKEIKEDLGKIISFCCAEPHQVWKTNSQKNIEQKGEFTQRLLRLCIALQAREEGLALLKILGTDFPSTNRTLTFEGIQTEQVAQAIADFECQITGWDSCCDLVQKMISPTRILSQLVTVIKLAHYLLDANCSEGAKIVADVMSSCLTNLDKPQAEKLNQPDMDAYMDLIFRLEMDIKTSNLVRLAWFISLFPKLSPAVKCRLVLDLETQCNSRLKGIESCYLLLQDLSKALSESRDIHSLTVLDIVEDVICCYIRLGNNEWLQSLISSLCFLPNTSEYPNRYTPSLSYDASNSHLLRKIVGSRVLWDLASSSEIGKSAMTLIVNAQLSLVVDQLSKLDSYDDDDEDKDLLMSLSNCLNFLMQLERSPQPSDSNHVSLMLSLLAKIRVNQLCGVVISVYKSNCETFKDNPSDLAIFNQICESLLLRMKEKQSRSMMYHSTSRQKCREVLMCFIQLSNESLTRSFLDGMCTNQLGDNFLNDNLKYEFLPGLISSSDIWDKLHTDSKLVILNTSISLLEEWLVQILKHFDVISTNSTALKSAISNCFELLQLIEKNRIGSDQKNIAHLFPPIFSKLPTALLMDLVLEIRESQTKARPNLKDFPICFESYIELCRTFFSKAFVPLVLTGDVAIKVVHCLVWLSDDQSWKLFAQQFCNCFPSDPSYHFVLVFSRNFIVHRALCDSPPAISAFNHIIDHLKKPANVLKEPAFTWAQSRAVVRGHSEVQAFLRANEEKLTYQKFSSIVEARDFALELERNHTDGFSVRANAIGSAQNARVIISKNKNHHFHAVKAFQTRQSELSELIALHKSLQEQLGGNGEVETRCKKVAACQEIRNVSSPAKRRKVDPTEINID